MREYELVLVFGADLSEKDQKNFIDNLKKEIETLKGKVEKVVDWGKKEFSYPVKKQKLGFYHILELSLPEELPSKLDAKLRIDEVLLRYLLVRRDIKKAPKERKKKNVSKIAK
jgi:small subunit ribosomal protein S6